LAAAPADGPGLAEALRPFRNDAGPTIEGVLGELKSRGWAQTSGHGLHSLTSQGAGAQQRLAELVVAQRRRVVDGISNDEYMATIAVLRRMAGNLDQAVRLTNHGQAPMAVK
jgi:hypothetical protein